MKRSQAGVGRGSDIPRRVPLLRFPEPLRARRRRCRRLRMWVPLLLLLPELLPAVPGQKLSALTVRPPGRWTLGADCPAGRSSGAHLRGLMRSPGSGWPPRTPWLRGQARAARRFGRRLESPVGVGSSAVVCLAVRGAAGTAAPSRFSRGEHGPRSLVEDYCGSPQSFGPV